MSFLISHYINSFLKNLKQLRMNLKEATISEISTYLKTQNFIAENEQVLAKEIINAGNMNFILKIKTNTTYLILKQANNYVEKYPQIAAPINRINIEYCFYLEINKNETLNTFTPKILGFDSTHFILCLAFIYNSIDANYIYKNNEHLSDNNIKKLCNYLSVLHQNFKSNSTSTLFENKEMRSLNHAHIFDLPFQKNNGFELDQIQQGLSDLALPYKENEQLKRIITQAGEKYLANDKYLLHGDFYPGSWLKTNNNIYVIDNEFTFHGPREFDIAVFIAHLVLSEHRIESIQLIKENYLYFEELDKTLLNQFIGIEIMRRLIGLAQLPLEMSLHKKEQLLKIAANLIT